MSISYTVFSNICEPLVAFLALLLQFISICTPWWARYSARTDLGKPEENGHYGLWTLCTKKSPHYREDCDPLDTFFELPPFNAVSGILCIVHLAFLVLLIPLGLLKTFQVFKNKANFCIKSKILRIVQVSVVLSSTLIAALVAIFASIGENQKEYVVIKSWSFWIQVVVIISDLALFALSSFECFRFLKLQKQQQIDPEGNRAETYGNPSFDADSPELARSHPPNNGVIAYTESSGYPYGQNPSPKKVKSAKEPTVEEISTKNKDKDSFQTLTYENECYLESSPRAGRRQ